MPLALNPLLNELTIKTKDLELRPLDLNYIHPEYGDFGWAQRPFVAEVERQYNSGLPVRILTLKARQLGISTVTEAILFLWGFIHHGTNGLVMTHQTSQSTELFQMTKTFWETWPFRHYYTLKYATKMTLNWTETRSKLSVGTARNVQSGRGSTFHAVHLSEAAFYPDPETLFTGLNQTIPDRHGSIVVIESTANGMGNWFYDKWQEAEEGSGEFTPLFFPWYKHPEYRLHTTLNTRAELDAEERQLLRVGATYENIAWRRRSIITKANGDLSYFMQEYPSTPEEAFITTGRPIFDHMKLKAVYKKEEGARGRLVDDPRGKPQFVRDPSGPLTIYRAPKSSDTRNDRYFIAGDPSETITGDPACIQVINRQTLEQVAVFHDRLNPIHFAHEMMRVGKYYNEAMLCPEVEGGGQATMATIIAANYPNIWMDKRPDRIRVGSFSLAGWSTNYQRKRWAIGVLQRQIIDKSIVLHDTLTYNQLRNFVEHDDGYWGNNDHRTHDDAVMALAIAVTASDAEGPFVADRRNLSPVHDIYTQEWETA